MKKLIRHLFEWAARKLGYQDVIYGRHELIKTEIPFEKVQAEVPFSANCPPMAYREEAALRQLLPLLKGFARFEHREIQPWDPEFRFAGDHRTRVTLFVGVRYEAIP